LLLNFPLLIRSIKKEKLANLSRGALASIGFHHPCNNINIVKPHRYISIYPLRKYCDDLTMLLVLNYLSYTLKVLASWSFLNIRREGRLENKPDAYLREQV